MSKYYWFLCILLTVACNNQEIYTQQRNEIIIDSIHYDTISPLGFSTFNILNKLNIPKDTIDDNCIWIRAIIAGAGGGSDLYCFTIRKEDSSHLFTVEFKTNTSYVQDRFEQPSVTDYIRIVRQNGGPVKAYFDSLQFYLDKSSIWGVNLSDPNDYGPILIIEKVHKGDFVYFETQGEFGFEERKYALVHFFNLLFRLINYKPRSELQIYPPEDFN